MMKNIKTRTIDREDMLALTRRMTLKRTSMMRIAGGYISKDGDVDGSFNINFLKLPEPEREKKLQIAKTIPFAPANEKLIRYEFSKTAMKPGSMWQLLMGIKESGLKNDALLDIFYEVAAERYRTDHDYGIYFFYDSYDIPKKASDKERLGESETTFQYMICAVCPVTGDYEPGKPECGFLFPAFWDGGGVINWIDLFFEDEKKPHFELLELLQLEEKEN